MMLTLLIVGFLCVSVVFLQAITAQTKPVNGRESYADGGADIAQPPGP